jgi:deazaflavin-dependent oxidoreductase (nitroreductase family)
MPLANLARRLGHRPWFARAFRWLVPLDRALGKVTHGRVVALSIDGLPSLLITTTGRKSGEPRTNPLLYAPDGDGYVVIGSNWGLAHHPAWSGNLLADPRATVTLGGRSFPVRADLATGPERDRLLALALEIWPAYQTYIERSGRDIRIFRLAPDASPDSSPGASSDEGAGAEGG